MFLTSDNFEVFLNNPLVSQSERFCKAEGRPSVLHRVRFYMITLAYSVKESYEVRV